MYETLAVLAGIGLLYAIFAGRIESSWVSGPMIFVAVGLALSNSGFALLSGDDGFRLLKSLAELTLALVLFTDAASANIRVLKRTQLIPTRMLAIGLPLTIAFGFVIGWAMFPQWPMLEIALLATILAPTDAALGKPVLANKRVPESMREALNVESGLNDGICVPILFLFLALLTGEASGQSAIEIGVHLFAEEVGIGILVAGTVVAVAVGLLKLSHRNDWQSATWSSVLVVGVAFTCFGVAQALGGSGFIASFVGGMLFGVFYKRQASELVEAAEGIGNTFAYLTWTLFGAVVVSDLINNLNASVLVYSLLSLTVVRVLPIFLSLTGLVQRTEEKLFLGWFGPRGLASIVFAVIVIADEAVIEQSSQISLIVACTVTMSVILHGITATPWANRIGQAPGTGEALPG